MSLTTDDFNPRIPYGMRPAWAALSDVGLLISIHASRMGCDPMETLLEHSGVFQSTHPVWDATPRHAMAGAAEVFQSTHPVWDATHTP